MQITMTYLLALLLVGRTFSLNVVDMPEILNQLAYCESSLNPMAYVKDDYGSPSMGLLQFKLSTWNWAIKKYNYKGLDIMNPDHQKLVAGRMIEDGLWKHWKICGKKIGLDKIYAISNN